MRKISVFIAVLCVLTLAIFCGAAYAQVETPPPESSGGETSSGNIYFYLDGELSPVPRDVAGGAQMAEFAMLELLKGPTEEEKASGYVTYIPEGVKLQYSTVKQDRSEYSVNLSSELLELKGEPDAAAKALAQIVKTLQDVTQIQDIGITVASEGMGSQPEDAFMALGVTTQESLEAESSSESDNTALILGVVLGGLGFLAVLAILLLYFLKKRGRTSDDSKSGGSGAGRKKKAGKGNKK